MDLPFTIVIDYDGGILDMLPDRLQLDHCLRAGRRLSTNIFRTVGDPFLKRFRELKGVCSKRDSKPPYEVSNILQDFKSRSRGKVFLWLRQCA